MPSRPFGPFEAVDHLPERFQLAQCVDRTIADVL
jgi:hypothetical protein